jgi:hypothetical protein
MMTEMRFVGILLLLSGCMGEEFTLAPQEAGKEAVTLAPEAGPLDPPDAGPAAIPEAAAPLQDPPDVAPPTVDVLQPVADASPPTVDANPPIIDAGPPPQDVGVADSSGDSYWPYVRPTFCSPFGRMWSGTMSECGMRYTIEMPIQFGAVKNDAGSCGSEWTPNECQCAETFTCECILARAGFGPDAVCHMESQVQGLPPGPKGPDQPPDLPVVTGYRKGY